MKRRTLTEEEKVKRLSLEVRFARDTCVSLPKSSEIFRIKRDYKNLKSDEYATNLKVYLDKVQTNASVSRDDFTAALKKVNIE